MSFPDQAQAPGQAPPPGPNDPGGPPPQPQNKPPPQTNSASPLGQMAQAVGLPPPNTDTLGTPDWSSQDGQAQFRGPGGAMYNYGGEEQDITGPQPRQSFIPSSMRGFKAWGDGYGPAGLADMSGGIPYGPNMPSPMEAYGIIRGAGNQMGIWASQDVGPYAARAGGLAMQFAPLLDALSQGRFSRNFNAARMGQLKLQQEQMLTNNMIAVQRQREESRAYRSVWEEWRLGAISDETARNRTRDLAVNNPVLREILATKDMKGVEAYLDWLDATTNDMEAGGVSLKKALGDRDVAAELGEAPGGGVGGPPRELPEQPGFAPIGGTKVAQGTQAPGQAPATPAAGSIDKELAAQGLTPQEIQIAHQLATGGEKPDNWSQISKSRYGPKIEQGAQAIRDRVDKTSQNPNLNPDQKEDAIDQVSPGMGGQLRNLANYEDDPYKIPAAQRERVFRLVQSIDPHWKPSNYAIAQRYHNANLPEARTVQRVSSLDGASWAVFHSLRDRSETERIPLTRFKEFYAGTWSGDPKYRETYAALRDFVTSAATIVGNGQLRVSIVNQMIAEMPPNASPAQIRVQVLRDIQGAYSHVRNINDQFKHEVHDPTANVPFYSKQEEAVLRGYMRINPYTGVVPSDAPDVVRSVGKPQPKTRPSWMTEEQAAAPPTNTDITDGRRFLREHKDSQDREVQMAMQRIRRWLGLFADPELGIDLDLER